MADLNQPNEEQKLFWGTVPTATAVAHTVLSGTRTLLKTIDISNDNAAARTVSVYLVVSGGSPTNKLIPTLSLSANEIFQWSGFQVLEAGDTVQIIASGTDVSIFISGAKATL